MRKIILLILVLVIGLSLFYCNFVDKPEEITINIGDTITVGNFEITFTEYEWVQSKTNVLGIPFDDPENTNKDFILKANVKNIGTEVGKFTFGEEKLFINNTYEYGFSVWYLRDKEDGSTIYSISPMETAYYEIRAEVNQEVNSIAETATVKLKQSDDKNADTYVLNFTLK